ncbi:MAG: hypothetical protein QOJ01_38 [Solirubrobacterales bacterium]|jgi:hypothetical protein|nr:hypothetical protein [Solirubrobacterales bacterium]
MKHLRLIPGFVIAMVALAAVALAAPIAAFAASPTVQQYNSIDPGGGGGGTVHASAGSGSSAGSLPFTGFDVAALVVAAAVLLIAGLVLNRRSGRSAV